MTVSRYSTNEQSSRWNCS